MDPNVNSVTFKVSNYRLIIAIGFVKILMFIILIYSNFDLNWIFTLLILVSFPSTIYELSIKLIVDQDGLVIRRLFRKDVRIIWDDILEQHYFNLGQREMRYLLLRKAIPTLRPIFIPKEFQANVFILEAWEQPTRLLSLIEPHLPAKSPADQLFVPFTVDRNLRKALPLLIAIGIAIVLFSLNTFR
ncbi:hypothetical protein SE18_20915 [Herpetosiphon geysericola]|uniref:PH domain-containing protein n=1 Tax=Herpetosiphon geysericola TaxID=70996 RepID=A0A0P6YG16_9CHLR|nr:hypothetical protein SE18_20915 [Herpetosiphon geysericola]